MTIYRFCLTGLAVLLAACTGSRVQPDYLTLTIVGTNDVHGELAMRDGPAGLEVFAGYVNALREARKADGGALLLIDGGDMWQGTLASNLSEGQAAVAAFNAIGYDAAAIGNHEFDFGPVGEKAIPRSPQDDPRGALKMRAVEARFPLLAANLYERESGSRWRAENVQPSVLLERAGIKVGIVGVMTRRALQATIAANVSDLEVTPLAPAIEAEARQLRQRGAQLVIVAAHAGGQCQSFDDPDDLSSCRPDSEIFQVARALPPGLVDQVIAGHVHQGLAHRVNGIVITSAYSSTRAFDRVDYRLDRASGRIVSQRVFPPQAIRAGRLYEGREVRPDPAVTAIARQATQQASALKDRPVGVQLSGDFGLEGSPDSPLGNLFNQALYESLEVDLVFQNVLGGLRHPLPAGELTFGDLFNTFPFDNRVVLFELTGRELRQVLASEAKRGSRTVGMAGVTARIDCQAGDMTVEMTLSNGRLIEDDDTLRVGSSDYLALGGANVLTAVIPDGGFAIDNSLPLVRDVIMGWLAQRETALDPSAFLTPGYQNWFRSPTLTADCEL